MPSSLIQNVSQIVAFTVAATGAVTITSVNGIAPQPGMTQWFVLRFAEGYLAELVLTASAGAVDGVLRHSTDGGVTFRPLPLKFAQLATPGTAALVFKPVIGLSDAAFVPTGATTGAAVAANFPFNSKFLQLYLTLATPGTTSGQLIFTMTAKGNTVE